MLAFGGVWEGDFTAKNLPIQRGKGIRCLRVDQTEKLQFVYVKVANGLHYGKLGHHLEQKYRKVGNVKRINKYQVNI